MKVKKKKRACTNILFVRNVPTDLWLAFRTACDPRDRPMRRVLMKLMRYYIENPQQIDGRDALGKKRSRTTAKTQPHEPTPSEATPARSFDPDSPPDLRFTCVLSADIGGEQASGLWKNVVSAAHRCAFRRWGTFEAVQAVTESKIARGKKSECNYVPDLNLSIQRKDAKVSWKQSLHLARELGVPIHVRFQWPDNDAAKYPGQIGSLSWQPSE